MKYKNNYGLNIEKVMDILQEEHSISDLQRKLGTKTHRLVLTGYLMALKDLGCIEEMSYPPSRIFQVKEVVK